MTPTPYVVQVSTVEPRPNAVVRRGSGGRPLADVIPAACGEVWQFLRASGVPNLGLNLAIYLNDPSNMEIGVLVTQPFTADGPVVCSATPAGLAASAVHFGPYNRLGDAHDAVTGWCAAQGYRLAGPSWEIYGHWNDEPARLRTDVFWLLDADVPPPSVGNESPGTEPPAPASSP
jgi:effector-binding domain-containing protein